MRTAYGSRVQLTGVTRHIMTRSILLGTLKNVFGSSDRRKCSGLETSAGIAKMIIEAGVKLTSIIIVWH